ncbi:hypothetical protein SPRG_13558 [Saprolegnia parasitica CBS 223.65]|uniref:Transcription termination and cleavage factor C-terminal domain-containing protein n=1 Tax=Saprolegnia parasitica (strain CBS 223.65) TaxID=695850 RepID=A0A067BRZ9_SAPPC|nr:hypothetical protein SPRG_13558 [Saprolegnia parasitica CBS 223.65]KDO21259.1 hypothetical protein SPRG_13558 [Saprolegnia parasitica CBS 223.65]|eukprot:XP_012208003.1 hypothetical protein SPRG_13558 [Saprolegnia parasitica CBS 223.65]
MATIQATAIEAMDEADVYELMYHMKHFCETKPEEAAQMLNEHIEFARALAQAQLRLGMYDAQAAEAATQPTAPTSSQRPVELQLDREQQELLEQVQNLAPEIIQALPFEQRKQIMELREAMGLPPV